MHRISRRQVMAGAAVGFGIATGTARAVQANSAATLGIIGAGGRIKRAYGDNLDNISVNYEYPGNLRRMLAATQLTVPRYRDVREQFFGTLGVLETHREYYKWDRGDGPVVQVKSKREITIDAVESFLTRVLAGQPENTAFSACESTFTSLLGRLAIDMKREVTWEEMMRS